MSRLDDELKVAFRRQEPPVDFAARVLARLDEPMPEKKPGFLRALASFFETPRLRWAALGATAIVVAIVLLWQIAPRQAAIDSETEVATTASQPEKESTKDENKIASEVTKQADEQTVNDGGKTAKDERKVSVVKHRRFVARRATVKVDPEAEAAKQQVLFALQLASNTFGDAQRAIQSDSHKPNTEPNR